MEKRLYRRENVNIEGLFYIQGAELGKIEFIGKVKNISEGGIAIEVVREEDISIADNVVFGTEIKFLYLDEYNLLEKKKSIHVEGVATVIRKEKKDNSLIIGCSFRRISPELEQYISDKKLVSFFSTGCRAL